MSSPEVIAARVAAALKATYRTRAERHSRPSPTREIMCRSCGRWTTADPTPEGSEPVWSRHHSDDGTPSCSPFAVPSTQGEPR